MQSPHDFLLLSIILTFLSISRTDTLPTIVSTSQFGFWDHKSPIEGDERCTLLSAGLTGKFSCWVFVFSCPPQLTRLCMQEAPWRVRWRKWYGWEHALTRRR